MVCPPPFVQGSSRPLISCRLAHCYRTLLSDEKIDNACNFSQFTNCFVPTCAFGLDILNKRELEAGLDLSTSSQKQWLLVTSNSPTGAQHSHAMVTAKRTKNIHKIPTCSSNQARGPLSLKNPSSFFSIP